MSAETQTVPASEAGDEQGSSVPPDPSEKFRHTLRLVVVAGVVVIVAVVIGVFYTGRLEDVREGRGGDGRDEGKDEQVTTKGTVEVTAKLVEIRGEFLPDDGFYNYAFIMKYKVLDVYRGLIDSAEIFVAHYNTAKPRPEVADEFNDVGGRLRSFREGDVHRMALDVPLDDHYMGGILNRYHKEHRSYLAQQNVPIPVYWAVWTNFVSR